MGSATALAPRCRGGGGREGREEEGDPVNKPRLNRLLGAVQAEPMPSLILKSGAIHHQRTGSFHGKLKRATLKGRGKNLSRGRANQSVAGVVWRGICCPRQTVIHCRAAPCHCQGGWRVQAAKCPLDGVRTAGMGTRRILLGSGENAGIAGERLWFAPRCGKAPAGGVSMTKAGSLWVLGEEVASGAATGRMSPGPP